MLAFGDKDTTPKERKFTDGAISLIERTRKFGSARSIKFRMCLRI
jgi:hypothetical protein